MYYVVKSIKDAEKIHKLHPNVPLDAIELKVKYALDTIRERYDDEPTVYITGGDCVEYCYLAYYKRDEGVYGKQGYLNTKIEY